MPEEKEIEEYELIPVSPLRKLEKRIEKLEATKASIDMREFLKEIVDIIKMNQSLVNEMMKSTDALKLEISKLPPKIDELVKNLNELITYVKAAAMEEAPAAGGVSGDVLKQLTERLGELAESNKKMVEMTETMISTLEEIDRKLRRPIKPRRLPPPPPLRRIPPPPSK